MKRVRTPRSAAGPDRLRRGVASACAALLFPSLAAAAEHGLRTVAVYAEDDAASLHTRKTDEAAALRGAGPAAYLDVEQIVHTAHACRCDAIHPGYGFLSERGEFARRCAAERYQRERPALLGCGP